MGSYDGAFAHAGVHACACARVCEGGGREVKASKTRDTQNGVVGVRVWCSMLYSRCDMMCCDAMGCAVGESAVLWGGAICVAACLMLLRAAK